MNSDFKLINGLNLYKLNNSINTKDIFMNSLKFVKSLRVVKKLKLKTMNIFLIQVIQL